MDFKQLRVLIAEDDLDDGEFICESFSKYEGISKVDWVKNGKELLSFLINGIEKRPDIILTDINMPIVNGVEALEEISKNKQLASIPVFVYSSSTNPMYEKKCIDLGAVGYLVKPFDFVAFSQIPNQIIDILKKRNY